MRFSKGKTRNGFDPKIMKPRVHLEDPHHLEIPIVISRYKYQKPTTINRTTEKRWPFKQEAKTPDMQGRNFALCTWICRKRALRRLEKIKEKEQERLKEIARRERELEFVRLMQKQQAYEKPMPPEVIPLKEKSRPRQKNKRKCKQEYREPELRMDIPTSRKKSKKDVWDESDTQCLKESKRESRISTWKEPTRKSTCATAKPKAMSKTVSAKKYCSHQPISVRFVNYCYRFCCQMFCCLTMLMLAGLAVILLI